MPRTKDSTNKHKKIKPQKEKNNVEDLKEVLNKNKVKNRQ